ncbi:MAG: phosphomethylpyrimidine synthase ThiC [Dehalococcoidia bacterium]|nr:MAG: phosphomethylpyrimidine synthase ThiC [Dehalococcoidia bacterium]
MTQLEMAKEGIISERMEEVARLEGLNADTIRCGVASGIIVIPANINHGRAEARGIGKGLSTKVNANIGTSSDFIDLAVELDKLDIAIEAGADAVMDLSTGGNLAAIRKSILARSSVPIGSVPIYQAGVEAVTKHDAIVKMTADELFDAIADHCRDGVDFITVHCGVTQRVISLLKQQGRVADVVSRGGAFLMGWMLYNQRENPLYEQFDRLLDIAREYDVTLSLGDGLRPGSLADATDRAQIEELVTLGELVQRSRQAGVQVMVEGPGHVPLGQIEANVLMQKRLCQDAPFYVLGPLVTDIAAGYDHITGAIGGAIAAAAGADFLCYVTPAEHLSLPDPEDVRQGVMASRIAAHAADIAKGVKGAAERDRQMSQARKRLDWSEQARLALDPARVQKGHAQHSTSGKACSMCGQFCAMQLVSEQLGVSAPNC